MTQVPRTQVRRRVNVTSSIASGPETGPEGRPWSFEVHAGLAGPVGTAPLPVLGGFPVQSVGGATGGAHQLPPQAPGLVAGQTSGRLRGDRLLQLHLGSRLGAGTLGRAALARAGRGSLLGCVRTPPHSPQGQVSGVLGVHRVLQQFLGHEQPVPAPAGHQPTRPPRLSDRPPGRGGDVRESERTPAGRGKGTGPGQAWTASHSRVVGRAAAENRGRGRAPAASSASSRCSACSSGASSQVAAGRSGRRTRWRAGPPSRPVRASLSPGPRARPARGRAFHGRAAAPAVPRRPGPARRGRWHGPGRLRRRAGCPRPSRAPHPTRPGPAPACCPSAARRSPPPLPGGSRPAASAARAAPQPSPSAAPAPRYPRRPYPRNRSSWPRSSPRCRWTCPQAGSAAGRAGGRAADDSTAAGRGRAPGRTQPRTTATARRRPSRRGSTTRGAAARHGTGGGPSGPATRRSERTKAGTTAGSPAAGTKASANRTAGRSSRRSRAGTEAGSRMGWAAGQQRGRGPSGRRTRPERGDGGAPCGTHIHGNAPAHPTRSPADGLIVLSANCAGPPSPPASGAGYPPRTWPPPAASLPWSLSAPARSLQR